MRDISKKKWIQCRGNEIFEYIGINWNINTKVKYPDASVQKFYAKKDRNSYKNNIFPFDFLWLRALGGPQKQARNVEPSTDPRQKHDCTLRLPSLQHAFWHDRMIHRSKLPKSLNVLVQFPTKQIYIALIVDY